MLIDAHVHLDKYGDLLDRALRDFDEQRIFTVATAMDRPSYLELRNIAERSELVLPFGIHPRHAQVAKEKQRGGMPIAIGRVVEALAVARRSAAQIEALVRANFCRLIADDPHLTTLRTLMSS